MDAMQVDFKDHPFFTYGRKEGVIGGEKRALLQLGRRRFGEPDAAVLAKVEAITDAATLERLLDRVLDAQDWASLLADE